MIVRRDIRLGSTNEHGGIERLRANVSHRHHSCREQDGDRGPLVLLPLAAGGSTWPNMKTLLTS
jgi:hypothetical protein